MFTTLIDLLRQGGASVDSDSLADALWLASVMGSHSDVVVEPDDAVDSASTYEVSAEVAVDVADRVPPPIQIPPTDYGLLGTEAPAADVGLLRPICGTPNQRETASLGVLPVLGSRIGFKRAIKPFLAQRRKTSTRLDENATLKRLSDDGPQALQPVFLPGSRRALRLSLIRERAGTNALWTQPLDELAALIRSQGTFKQQREWSLAETASRSEVGSSTVATLTELSRHGSVIGEVRRADKIKWWQGEILLIASDFTSAGWWNGVYLKLLRSLAAEQPVLLLHTLPKRLWSRSWTGEPDAWVSSAQTLVATRAMEVHLDLHDQSPVRVDSRLAIPLIEFEAHALKTWARCMMGGAGRTTAIMLDEREPEQGPVLADEGSVDAKILATQFRMASSPLARTLAQYMSATAPLSFPVMRWVQQAMLPESDTSHLAEFILGGLLEALPSSSDAPADEVVYDFIDGLRPMLQQGMHKAQGLNIQALVGDFLERRHSDQLDMRAIVETWTDDEINQLTSEHQAFAAVSRAFLERIGLRSGTMIAHAGSAVELSSAIAPPERDSTEWVSASAPQPLIVLEATESSGAEDHVRKLHDAVIDLQWSPLNEDLLAIQTVTAVELWRPAHEPVGRTIRRRTRTKPAQPSVVTLVWWAPDEAPGKNSNLEAVKGIVRRVAEGLADSVCGRVRLRRLLTPALLQHRRFNAQALLVFETQQYAEWTDNNHEAFKIIDRFVERQDIISASIQMGIAPTVHHGITRKYRIKERFSVGSQNQFETQVWRVLKHLMRDLRESIQRHYSERHGMSMLTAISWLPEGKLGVADFDGSSTRLTSLDLGPSQQGKKIVSQSLAVHIAPIPVTRLFAVPLARRAQSIGSVEANPKLEQIVYMDGAGTTYLSDGTSLAELSPGIGFPRQPVFSPASSLWGVTSDSASLVMTRPGEQTPTTVVSLLPSVGGNLEDALQAMLHDKVLAGWVRDDSVFAITAAGFLHHGSIYDVFESRYKASRPLDLNPLDLQGTLHSACCSADGGRFAVVTVSGRVELWDAEDLMRLKSWQMTPSVAPFKQVCVALSGSGRQVAFACGQILRVVEEPLRNMDDRKWERHVLWVDDRPRNNEYERENLAKLGIRCTLALSTDAALDLLARRRFAVVISDMGREEGPSEGYVLLRKLRSRRSYTPFFIYAGSNLPEHRAQAKKEGAQGSTNNWTELLSWITAVIPKLQSSDRS